MKTAFKKAKTKDGITFSRIYPKRIKAINYMTREFGRDAITNPRSQFWGYFRDKISNRGSDIAGASREAACFYAMAHKKWLSVYIPDPSLLNFLESVKIKECDFELVKQASLDIHDASIGLGVMIHLPNRTDSVFVVHSVADDSHALVACFGESTASTPIGNAKETINAWEEQATLWSMVFGLFIYMNAFPECVSKKPPYIVSGQIDRSNCITVSTHDTIQQDAERQKSSPHFRRGHFRVLKDERYTKKRFQAVYVKPSMIGGDALTVTVNRN